MTTLVWFTKYWPRCRCPPAPPCRSWPRSRSWWWACSGRSAGGWAPSWPGWPWCWGQGSGSDPLTLETGHWLCVQLAPALTPDRKAPGFTDSADAAEEEEPIVCGWVGVILITLTHCRLLPSFLCWENELFVLTLAGLVTPPLALSEESETCKQLEHESVSFASCKQIVYTDKKLTPPAPRALTRHLYTWHVTRDTNVNIYFFSNKWS